MLRQDVVHNAVQFGSGRPALDPSAAFVKDLNVAREAIGSDEAGSVLAKGRAVLDVIVAPLEGPTADAEDQHDSGYKAGEFLSAHVTRMRPMQGGLLANGMRS